MLYEVIGIEITSQGMMVRLTPRSGLADAPGFTRLLEWELKEVSYDLRLGDMYDLRLELAPPALPRPEIIPPIDLGAGGILADRIGDGVLG